MSGGKARPGLYDWCPCTKRTKPALMIYRLYRDCPIHKWDVIPVTNVAKGDRIIT